MATDNGISHGVQTTRAVAQVMAAFTAIALYNVIELIFIIGFTFKRRKGLYFWSFVVATGGIVPYALGFAFKFFEVIPVNMVSITMVALGWMCMITGQSTVLYSRLHLVERNEKVLRAVLYMIIFNGIICHVPIVVMVFGANSNNPEPFQLPYTIYEKVQITIFFLQEIIISGIYIISTTRMLKPAGNIRGEEIRKLFRHLIYINAVIVVLDLTLLGIEYAGHYEIQVLYKAALYSVKLKMEFRILNQLVEVTQSKSGRQWSDTGTNQISTVRYSRTYTPGPLDLTPQDRVWIAHSKSYVARIGSLASNYEPRDVEAVGGVLMETEVSVERSDSVPDIDEIRPIPIKATRPGG